MSKMTGSKGRGRSRNNSGKRPQGRSGNFDQNGGRSRGNAQQLMDKYMSLARDATQQGDRIAAENYHQHADHYYRIVNARNEQQVQRNEQQNEQQNVQRPQQSNNSNNSNNNNGNEAPSAQPNVQTIPVQSAAGDKPAEVKSSPQGEAPKVGGSVAPVSESVVETKTADVEKDALAVKKPRRGRPPKGAAVGTADAQAPEAAE